LTLGSTLDSCVCIVEQKLFNNVVFLRFKYFWLVLSAKLGMTDEVIERLKHNGI